ncbi:MAG: N-acetylmuramoyl-L-alanine amidase [Bacteriovoracaceae bacterium]|nr:N-acetylmuramoyl-L-alanine amidase [Bacteriovoracaceae bacterium]
MKTILALSLSLTLVLAQGPQDTGSLCRELLGFIQQELTVRNMEKSLDRLNRKLTLAMLSSLRNSELKDVDLLQNQELLSLFESMKKIDPDFEKLLSKNKSYSSYKFWQWLGLSSTPKSISYQNMANKWAKIQREQPELFTGLESEHLLDEWDLKTAGLLEGYKELHLDDPQLKASVEKTALLFNSAYQDLIDSEQSKDPNAQITKVKKSINDLQKSFGRSAQDLLLKSLNDYQYTCDKDQFGPSLEALACSPEDQLGINLDSGLVDISRVLSSEFLNKNQTPPDEKGFIKIRPYEYENTNYNASFCVRDPAIVDTVVVHHSGTPNTDTPQDIHNIQVVQNENNVDSLGRADPWYMIAYNYVLNAGYEGETQQTPKVYRGRPSQIKGAHAGGYVEIDKMNPKAREKFLNSTVTCGYNLDEDKEHKIDKLDERGKENRQRNAKQGLVSANLTSVGVLVTGNYAPDIVDGQLNPSGYPTDGPVRYPSTSALKASAKLICQLRSTEHPNLTKISDHNYIKIKRNYENGKPYAGSCCPGTVYLRMQKLHELVKQECPQFEFQLDISPKETVCPFLRKL